MRAAEQFRGLRIEVPRARAINGADRAMVSPGQPVRPRDFALYAFSHVRRVRTACAHLARMHGEGNALHGAISG